MKLSFAIMVLTEPEIGPSWADFPLTLKLTSDQTRSYFDGDD